LSRGVVVVRALRRTLAHERLPDEALEPQFVGRRHADLVMRERGRWVDRALASQARRGPLRDAHGEDHEQGRTGGKGDQ
jgi:hypothetical protein